MNRTKASLVVLALVLTSGCSLLPADSPSLGGDDATTPTPAGEVVTASAPAADDGVETGPVLLETGEVGSGYSQTGEARTRTDTATDETARRFRRYGVRVRHERSFGRDDDGVDGAAVVLSSVTVYRNASAARAGERRLAAALADGGATVDETQLRTGVTVRQATFTNTEGARNSLVVDSDGRLVYYVVVSDPERRFSTQARRLFVTMASDVY